VGQTGRSIETRCKEHMRHIRLDQPEKSAVAWFPITRMLASQKAEPGKESDELAGKPPVANGQP
jgi:hypothetical protein